LQGLARSLHFFIGVFMRKASLALSCFLLAGTVLAQQAPSKTPSSTPAAAPSDSPAPANPLTDAQAKDMLEMTGASAMKEQLQHTMMNYFKTNMPFLPQDVSTDLEESFQKLDFDTPIIAIYKQHISTEDATAIIAFYKTPAGKDMMKVMPELLQQSQQVGMQLGRKTAQEVIQRHRPEIEAAAKQYQEEHAPKPAPSLTTPSPAAPAAAPAAKPATPSPNTAAPQPH
jgi:hypothetical protein